MKKFNFRPIRNVRAIRKRLSQQEFWQEGLGVTQSGGSRYESGQKMPNYLRALIRVWMEHNGEEFVFSPIRNIRAIRRRFKLNQTEFWKDELGMTQSGGCRYEAGRRIPKPLRALIRIWVKRQRQAK